MIWKKASFLLSFLWEGRAGQGRKLKTASSIHNKKDKNEQKSGAFSYSPKISAKKIFSIIHIHHNFSHLVTET